MPRLRRYGSLERSAFVRTAPVGTPARPSSSMDAGSTVGQVGAGLHGRPVRFACNGGAAAGGLANGAEGGGISVGVVSTEAFDLLAVD